MCFKKIQQYKK